jgi:hypothetical protein
MADDAIEYGLGSESAIVDDDQALVSAAQEDPEAAGRLYDKYYGEVFGYIYHSTLDRCVTEDLTSNVFLAAFRHLGRYRWQQIPFRAWLYRIATNDPNALPPCRWDRTAGLQVSREATMGPSADAVQRRPRSIVCSISAAELKLVIARRSSWYIEGKTIAEIASITGQREGTIKS